MLNNDEEQVHDVMISLVDKIDKESNPSNSTDIQMLFNASSTLQRYHSKTSTDNNNNNNDDSNTFLPISSDDNFLENSNDSYQPLDDYKHSIGILQNDNDENNSHLNDNDHEMPSSKFENIRFHLLKLL